MTDNLIERLERMRDFYDERPAIDQTKQVADLTELTEREAGMLCDAFSSAIALIRAQHEALREAREALGRLCEYENATHTGLEHRPKLTIEIIADFRRARETSEVIGEMVGPSP